MSTQRMALAEDDEIIRSQLVQLIEESFPELILDTARNGQELVELTERNLYGLIVTDYRMPGMTGLEAIKVLRERKIETPIYMISADEVGKKAVENGATGYIPKPADFDQVEELIDKHLY
jgi:DNA-binding NarL/FixJ family response regulator